MFIEASNKTTTTTFLCPLQNEAGTFLWGFFQYNMSEESKADYSRM